MNLYPYLPPHSAHPKSTLNGMIYSVMQTYYKQNTLQQDYHDTVITMFHHLLARGWDTGTLKKTILAADITIQQKHSKEKLPENQTQVAKTTLRNSLFFHLPYHPNDITRRRIQQLYNYYCHDTFNTKLDIDKFTVAYSRHKNLKEDLTQARLHQVPSKVASAHVLCPDIIETIFAQP
jgi:hypothetical protein